VIVIGEDVAEGGPYTATAGLADAFGRERVRNTPISESTVAGIAVGAAQAGHRPIVEIMFIDFITLALDQLANQGAKAHFMSGGQLSVPLVMRTQGGAGQRGGAQHSQSLESWLAHVPGLKVVMPSTAVDAAGLMTTAIADPDPVVFIETKALYFLREEIDGEPPAIPLGMARTFRPGGDLTIVATARMVGRALEAAEVLAAEGVEAAVIDPRTLVPLDLDTITASVAETNHLLIVEEAVSSMGFGAEIAAQVQSVAFDDLDAPVQRLGAPFTPIPLSPALEDAYIPDTAAIVRSARELLSLPAAGAA
jgi:pyruvate dehydrogenase E1 component beta subunit